MEELDKIVFNTKYTQSQKISTNYANRIVTNVGVFFKNYNISDNTLEKIKCMKVYGRFMETSKFELFTNLEVLDVTSMDFIKERNPFADILNKIEGKEKEKLPDTELLQISLLKKLKTLKIILKTKQENFGSDRIRGDYSFLKFLPSELNTLIIVGLSNATVKEINFSNIPSTVTKIELHKQAINKSKSLKAMLIEQLNKYKYPFGCKIYLDNVELEL